MGILGVPLGWIMYGIDLVVNNYGWSLIIFILLTKVALWPLNVKQKKSSAKMAVFQPKLKALEKQYGKNKQKYQEEMMKLYEKEGVNPAGGCLPAVVQMVLLFGIIDVIYKPLQHLLRLPTETIKAAEKLLPKIQSASQIEIISQIQNGSTTFNQVFSADMLEKINNFDMNFFGINMGAIPNSDFWSILLLIPVLSFVTAVISMLVSMKEQKQMGQAMQGPMKYMFYFMPLMSLWIAFGLPAGVGFYWTISNIFQIGQTLLLQKIYTPEKLASQVDKSSEKAKERMKKRREKMEQYNKMMEERGLTEKKKPLPKAVEENSDLENLANDKELASRRLAEARKRMAEKYGDTYTDDELGGKKQ